MFAMAARRSVAAGLAMTNRRDAPVRITVVVAILIAVAATAFPDVQARGDGQHRNAVRLHSGLGRGVIILRRTRPDLN